MASMPRTHLTRQFRPQQSFCQVHGTSVAGSKRDRLSKISEWGIVGADGTAAKQSVKRSNTRH